MWSSWHLHHQLQIGRELAMQFDWTIMSCIWGILFNSVEIHSTGDMGIHSIALCGNKLNVIHYIRVGHVNIIPSDFAMPLHMASHLFHVASRGGKKTQWFSTALLIWLTGGWQKDYWRSQELNQLKGPSIQKNTTTNPSPQTKSPWERCWCVKFKGDERLCKACNEMTWIGENGNQAQPLAKLRQPG